MKEDYQALVVVSFGGPEGMEDVIPFLENVLRGKSVPRRRLEEVARHYQHFGGVSPINRQNRELIRVLERELREHGISWPVYLGNRNWHPLLSDTLQQMAQQGVRRALAFVTSAYSSYSNCRQYLEDIERARQALGSRAPEIHKLRPFFNHPGFVEANADRLRQALDRIPPGRRKSARLLFSAHSIPLSMAAQCAYQEQLSEVARLVSEAVRHPHWQLVYQSRSGPPHQPWLEPDVSDVLAALPAEGVRDVVIAPIGFLSDHMEVIYDLDTDAAQLCRRLGLNMIRAATVGTHPRFVRMIRELVEERLGRREVAWLGRLPPAPHVCPPGCCPRGKPAPQNSF